MRGTCQNSLLTAKVATLFRALKKKKETMAGLGRCISKRARPRTAPLDG